MFAIQSLPRCGTHLLRTALNSNAEIACFGEVFNPYSQIHGFPINRPTVADVMEYCQSSERQTGFLAHAYVGLTEDEKGKGLGMAYRRRLEVQVAQGLWRMIPKNAPIVTLFRTNLLERYVSLMVALHRQTWIVYRTHPKPKLTKLRVDCQRMLADFEQTESLMEIARLRFPEAFFLSYEELVADSTTFERVQKHLGVAVKSLSPLTQKVGGPLKWTLLNFQEVRSALQNTRYSKFIEAHE